MSNVDGKSFDAWFEREHTRDGETVDLSKKAMMRQGWRGACTAQNAESDTQGALPGVGAGQGSGEAVAEIELSDYIHLAGATASHRKALKELSEGSIQSLPVGTKLYTHPSASVPKGWLVREVDDRITVQHPDIGGYCASDDGKDQSFIAPVILYHFAKATLTTTPQPASGWVKCSERLPESKRLSVLACQSRNGIIKTATLEDGTWRTGISAMDYLAEVTHWMPLPNPPADQEQNDE